MAFAIINCLAACTPQVFMPPIETSHFEISGRNFIAPDGSKLPFRTWTPQRRPEATILALHGFNDYGHFFDAPGNFFASKGLIAYAYDQRGFGAAPNPGTWAGVSAYVRDALDAAHTIKKRHPELPLYLLGSSMGGAVALLAANETKTDSIDGIILAAPAIWGRLTMPWYQRFALWIAFHTLPYMTLTGHGLDVLPSDNEEMLIRLGRDPLVIKETRIDTIHGLVNLMDAALAAAPDLNKPTLILYGEKDEIIPKRPTGHLLQMLPKEKTRIALYAEGHHMLLRDLQAMIVWRDIVTWVKNQNTPLPSQADRRNLKSLGIKNYVNGHEF